MPIWARDSNLRQVKADDGGKEIGGVEEEGICFNCFSGGHISRLCDQPRSKCGSCGDYHHTVLHVERKSGGGGGRVGGVGNGNGGGNGGSKVGNVAAASVVPPAPPAPPTATTTGAVGATGTGVLNAKSA